VLHQQSRRRSISMSVPPYEIVTKRPPPNIVPLTVVPIPNGHPMKQHVETEAEALAICDKMIRDGYHVEVKRPNGLHWDSEEVKRRVKAVKA
jgi:hypothetical protein